MSDPATTQNIADPSISDEALDAASAFVWKTAAGNDIALKDMGWSHLVNLLKYVRKKELTGIKEHEEFLLWQLDPEVSSSFSGREDMIENMHAARANATLEIRRRLRFALRKKKLEEMVQRAGSVETDKEIPYD